MRKFRVVFPTYVGVFLSDFSERLLDLGLPHVRGGVSRVNRHEVLRTLSSPRTWGCFLADAVDVFTLDGLPHVRGGVSKMFDTRYIKSVSSPRTWGVSVNPFT